MESSVQPWVKGVTEAREEITHQDRLQRQILGSLYSINLKMKEMTQKRGELRDQLMIAEGDVRSTARQIAKIEDRLKEQREYLSLRLRSFYMLQGQSSVRIIFSSESAYDFDRNLNYLKRLTNRDYQLIQDFEATLAELNEKRSILRMRVERLVRTQQRLNGQEKILSDEQFSKSKLIDQLRASRQLQIKRLQLLREKTEHNIELDNNSDFDTYLQTAFFERKGQMLNPVEGYLKHRFGYMQDAKYRFSLSHKGLFFEAPQGSDVLSVFSGEVVFAGSLPGYGQLVVVDHRDHYYSVYAYNSALYVKTGQKVTEGQKIAASGRGELNQGPGVYFEIRHFSEALDPAQWLASIAHSGDNLGREL